jgi:hypothetical protein
VVKKLCPCLSGSDKVGSVKESVTWGESEVVREIYADER